MNNVSIIFSEGAESFASVARRIPSNRRTGHVTPEAVWRWYKRGILRKDGTRVHLEAVLVSGRYLTSWGRVEAFLAATQDSDAPPLLSSARSPGRREKSSNRAAEKLAEIGI